MHSEDSVVEELLVSAEQLAQLGFVDAAPDVQMQSAPAVGSSVGLSVDLAERYRGSLLGLAAGDALGTTVEFSPPGSFKPLRDLVGGGPFQLQAGEWTDDTSMAFALAASLVACRGFDAADQMRRYRSWFRNGEYSSTGSCFDIGNTTVAAIRQFEATGEPYVGSTDPRSAGNGSLMRLAPIPLAYRCQPAEGIRRAAKMSRTTHGTRECLDACRYYTGLIIGALQGQAKDALLAPNFSPVPNLWRTDPLSPKIAAVARGSFKHKNPPELRGTGYVVDALEASLWAFHHSTSFKEGALAAVNLGDDADTTGAIYGQLAGAYYGVEAIPKRWRTLLSRRQELEGLALELLRLSTSEKFTRPESQPPALDEESRQFLREALQE